MQQQTNNQNNQVCDMCKYFVSYTTNKICDFINYYLCIKQKVDDDEYDDDEYDDDAPWVKYNDNIPGPYDDLDNDQWNNVSYDGYDGYDN